MVWFALRRHVSVVREFILETRFATCEAEATKGDPTAVAALLSDAQNHKFGGFFVSTGWKTPTDNSWSVSTMFL